ncbi:hypothetical protein EDB80DRAFT_224289 [Ilyonectria destructans]|nr:hypothetical protein EDB80DRAFT_224289 [Ilyonectria destructans]
MTPEASPAPPSNRPWSPLRSPSPLPSWLESSPPPSPSAQLLPPSSSPPPLPSSTPSRRTQPIQQRRQLTAPPITGTYATHEDAFAAMQADGREQGYAVVYSRPSNYKDGKPRRHELICACGGRPFISRSTGL